MQIKQYFRGSNHYYEKRNYKLRISIKPTEKVPTDCPLLYSGDSYCLSNIEIIMSRAGV